MHGNFAAVQIGLELARGALLQLLFVSRLFRF